MQDRVGALETAVDDTVDHGLRSECAKMPRDIVFCTHLDVFRRVLLVDLPASVEPMIVRLQPGTTAVRAKPHASPIVYIPGDENCWGNVLSRWVTRPGGPVYVHASVKYTEVLFAGSAKFPTKKRGVRAAAAEGGPTLDTPRYGVGGGFTGFRRAAPGGAPWLPRDLGAGRCRLFEEATAGVCPLYSLGGGRTPRGRCNDGSAWAAPRVEARQDSGSAARLCRISR